MITQEAASLLWDAQRAAEGVLRFTAGRSFDDYLADDMLRRVVEREFEIIGEALAGLRRIAPEAAAQIPDLPRVIAFRNLLILGCATIDNRVVWDAIQGDLPALRAAIDRLLRSGAGP